MFLDLIRYIRYVCKSAHRIVCENMWCVYVILCSDQLSMCFRITLRFDYIYICVCVCSMVPYMFGKLYRIFWVKLWNQTCALLDFILLYIVYNCLLDVWLTPSITNFRLKFIWGTKPLNFFVRCKVERGSFWRSQ